MRKGLCLLLIFCFIFPLLPAGAAAAELDVAGKSALLMDAATGRVLYEKNAHEKLSPASVTKVMTLLLIMEAIDSGKIGWNDTVTASESAAAKGGSQIFLKVGESMSVTDLVKSIAVSSANDAACAMAEHLAGSETAFVAQMNDRAAQLGMTDTHFVNCTGLDDSADAATHLTSAHDIAIMSRELMVHHPDITKFTTIWMDTVRNGTFGLANTNKLIRFYPGAIGLKTGYTAKAGFCLSACAQRENMMLIAVVLGAESSQDRFAACKSMLDYGFANFALTEYSPEELTIPVKLGQQATVSAIPGGDTRFLIDKSQRNDIRYQVNLAESVAAPVSQGQQIGTLTIYAGQQILNQIPMVAKDAVLRKTWGQIFMQILKAITMGG